MCWSITTNSINFHAKVHAATFSLHSVTVLFARLTRILDLEVHFLP